MTPLLSAFVLAASTFATPPALSTPAACASVPAPVEQASFDFDNGGGETVNADCTAYCGSSPPVSCSGSTCVAVDQSCPSQRGYATCDGVTYYCPACPTATCTEGAIKSVITGPYCSCEDGMSTPRDRYKCINGEWVYQYSFCGGPFCQGY